VTRAAAPRMRGQEAERAEYRRRGADRAMLALLHERGQQIADGTGSQDREPRDARAEVPAEEKAEEAAEREVAREMQRIAVQRQRGDDAPRLAIDDGSRDQHPLRVPVD